jgi:hypothetical protein
MRQRTFEEHLALFAAYADAVASLPASSWERLARACASLDGDSFRAVLKRGRLHAKAFNMMEQFAGRSRMAKAIAAVTTATITGIGVTSELVGEFEAQAPSASIPSYESSTDPESAKYVDAWFAIEAAIHSSTGRHAGVAAAIRAAGQAVLRHDWLSAETFAAVYGFVESEIPYATLERGGGGT